MSKKKIKVVVLMGGPSSEYEISLATAKNVIQALDPKKYLVRPVLINKTGRWLMAPSFQTPLLFSGKISKSKALTPIAAQTALNQSRARPDVVFIAMHGEYGEDGRIQSLLELAGIPYTGSGVLASALAMDKVKSAQFFQSCGLKIPKFIAFTKNELTKNKAGIFAELQKLIWPLVIKPVNLGSSVGVSIIKNINELAKAVKKIWPRSDYVMAQEFIKGKEVTCGVLDIKGKITPLPLTEIIPKLGVFYDYKSKYVEGGSKHIISPKDIPLKIVKKVQKASVLAHNVIGCSGMSRSDFILGKDGKLYILEINTIPGMTSTSLIPEAAKAVGIDFPKFLDLIIDNALYKKTKML